MNINIITEPEFRIDKVCINVAVCLDISIW